jgi:hypothetical protein
MTRRPAWRFASVEQAGNAPAVPSPAHERGPVWPVVSSAPVRFGHLLQPVAAIDDWPDRLRLGQFFQQGQVAGEQLGCPVVDRDADPAGGQRPAAERPALLRFPTASKMTS